MNIETLKEKNLKDKKRIKKVTDEIEKLKIKCRIVKRENKILQIQSDRKDNKYNNLLSCYDKVSNTFDDLLNAHSSTIESRGGLQFIKLHTVDRTYITAYNFEHDIKVFRAK